MDECIDPLGDGQVYSTLDANSGHWWIEADPSDCEKAAFVSSHRL